MSTANPAPPLPFFYGGQAVIEGVLMRGPHTWAVAARRPDGGISLRQANLTSRVYTSAFFRLPFIRGVIGLVEMLHLGTSAMLWSANVKAKAEDIEISRGAVTVTIVLSMVFSFALFFGLPLVAGGALRHRGGSLAFTVVEGTTRALLLVGYLLLISRIPDVRRLFQYHGAEHKTINAFEAGWPLEVAHVKRASLLHPRCGTGFLVVVLVVSLVVFSLVALLHPNFFWLVASRILGVPVIAGVGFEWIRFMARHQRNPVVKVMLWPVLGTQKFTTREPDAEQLEVAIAAFNAARQGEERAAA